MPSVVRALHQAQQREGPYEVRHADRAGAAALLWHAGDHQHQEDGLPHTHEVPAVRRKVSSHHTMGEKSVKKR